MGSGVGRARMTVMRRTRLAVAGVAIASVLLLAGVVYTAWLQHTEVVRTTELARQVSAIAAGFAAGDPLDLSGASPLEGLRAELFEVEARLIGTHLVLTDAEGVVRHSSTFDGTLERYDIERLTGPADVRGVRTGTAPVAGAGRVIIVAAPVPGVASDGYLVAVQPIRELAAARRGGGLILVAVTLVVVAGAWLAGGIIAHRITAPLVRLREGAEAIAGGSWGLQVAAEGDEEVAALATAFNTMSSRVDAAYTAQREFVGDVSHELRTPITSIQGFAGALLDDLASDDEQRERFARIIREESGRLMELTGTLLALADLDSGRVRLASVPVDTVALAEALASRHEMVAHRRQVTLDIGDLAASGRPVADDLRLLQVASALVANAITHAPPDSTVRVGSCVRDGRWCLEVDDAGPGVPEHERDRVFERFVRLDVSRSAESGGSGLGLAICRRLVELMGGTIAAETSGLGGARFVVCLDLAQGADPPGGVNRISTGAP
ncbi:MAG: HAMP domain-containing sensor histidine kinase [Coriobacteriia bacterium]|nr:HAMP domain-containing sensor histidine kinase [Coriobacteriia bacterium]